jgi:hypothetical protein
MNDFLIMLHFFGLGAGFAGAIAGPLVGRQLAASPGDGPVLTKLQPLLARTGQIGLGLLWITGLIMMWSIYGGPGALPATFGVKIACVVAITALVATVDIQGRKARAGDEAARALMPILGAISGVLLILTVVFAVWSFH